jgi:hypothetical protein
MEIGNTGYGGGMESTPFKQAHEGIKVAFRHIAALKAGKEFVTSVLAFELRLENRL